MKLKAALGALGIASLVALPPRADATQIRYRSRSSSPSHGELERVQFSLEIRVEPGNQSGCADAEIPSDRRIVIDQISGDVTIPLEEHAVVTVWSGPDRLDDDGGGLHHYFTLTDTGTNLSDDAKAWSYSFNEQPNIFSDGFLNVCVVRGPAPSAFTAGAHARISISGRLVIPPAP